MANASFGHLLKRFWGSLNRRAIPEPELSLVATILTSKELTLWRTMSVQDQRHSIVVLSRYRDLRPTEDKRELSAVLLHDVGKTVSDLSTVSRVFATVCGRRGKRFREYHDHEALGAVLADRAGSDPLTVDMIRGTGPVEATRAMIQADNY